MNKTIRKLALVAAVASMSSAANAMPILVLDDGVGGANALWIADGSQLDANPLAGAVTYVGPYGGFTINVDTGLSKPVVGSASNPIMDLNFIATGIGTLNVSFADMGFSKSGTLVDLFGGTLDGVEGSISDTVGLNMLTQGSILTQVGPFGPGAFAGSDSALVTLTPRDQLWLNVLINLPEGGTVSGDKYVSFNVPDSGTTAMLLGGALSCLALIRRKLA